MFVESIGVKNFRLLHEANINTSCKTILLTGANGSGKTSLIEAIYSALTLSSFRTSVLNEVIAHNKGCADIVLNVLKDNEKFRVHTSVASEQKKVLVNDYPIKTRKEMFKLFSVVCFSTKDIKVVDGSPRDRRSFVDSVLSILNPEYYSHLLRYKKLTCEKLTLLSSSHYSLLPFYAEALQSCTDYVHKCREKFVLDLQNYVCTVYNDIFNEKIECFSINYLSSKNNDEWEISADDFLFLLNNEDSKNLSNGQKRMLSLILKISSGLLISKLSMQKPVILCDDILLEMDAFKKIMFFNYINSNFSQIFWTFTEVGDNITELCKDNCIHYQLNKGRVKVA